MNPKEDAAPAPTPAQHARAGFFTAMLHALEVGHEVLPGIESLIVAGEGDFSFTFRGYSFTLAIKRAA